MPVTAGSVILRAAIHLNDPSQLVYTSPVLLPFLNMAIDELAEELAVFEITPLRKESVQTDVNEDATTIVSIPSDFLEAVALYERDRDSSDLWFPVTEVIALDLNLTVQQAETITQWTSRGSVISINPPSTDREVIIEYMTGLTEAATTATNLNIDSARRFLALVTARNAARDAGNSITKANSYEADIVRSRDRLTRRLQKNSQHASGTRRRPYVGRG